jgi:hypothetical protein
MRYLFLILLFISCNGTPKNNNGGTTDNGGGVIKPPPDEVIIPIDTIPNYRLNWPDRRPIGMIMLSNYTYWTGTDNYMNGEQPFDTWLLDHAANCIKTLKYWNAQGAIIWDPEGSKFPRAYTYYGDPKMAPEKVDPFFKAITDAGFRTGICIRPDTIKWVYNEVFSRLTPHHFVVTSPLDNMIAKVDYARKRWGCTLFYVDSNIGAGQEADSDNTLGYGKLLPASIFATLSKLYSDCLFIPEWHDASYAPYTALYWHKGWSNNMSGLTVIDAADTNWPQEWLNQAVKNGHILMGRAWWGSEIDKIKEAYNVPSN